MKILLVSMPSLHFFRWTEQLKDTGHEVYWFDITDGGKEIGHLNWVMQIVGWKLKWNYPGRHFIKKRAPKLYSFFQKLNDRKITKVFEQKLLEIQPDVVHSFALYVSCAPIMEVMNKYSTIKWIYSSWGSDLYYFQNKPNYLSDIKKVLPRVDYLFTDCIRDHKIAQQYGFKGEFLGVFPGGGGFPLDKMNKYESPLLERKLILVKGYQGRSGRAIQVLKVLEQLSSELKKYEIVVFGADKDVFDYVKRSKLIKWHNFKVFGKLSHNEVLQLMGKSLIYIGNSNSDGIPNTLLEAVCMGVFPIQSNPGGVTEEIIENGKNGLLIDDCENEEKIKTLILKLLSNPELIGKAFKINQLKIKPQYDRTLINQEVLSKYDKINSDINKMMS